MMKRETIKRTLAGWVVLLIVYSIILAIDAPPTSLNSSGLVSDLIYGFTTALLLFSVSIVCTLGVSLIIWVPLGYGVGWVVFKITGWDKTAEDTQQSEPQSVTSPTFEQQALLSYIKEAREKGESHHQISSDLERNGWTIDEVNWAFDALK